MSIHHTAEMFQKNDSILTATASFVVVSNGRPGGIKLTCRRSLGGGKLSSRLERVAVADVTMKSPTVKPWMVVMSMEETRAERREMVTSGERREVAPAGFYEGATRGVVTIPVMIPVTIPVANWPMFSLRNNRKVTGQQSRMF